jgi:hypothetical protein
VTEQWELFRRVYAKWYGSVEVQIAQREAEGDSRRVGIVLNEVHFEGYSASFYLVPDLQGAYEIATQGMVNVPNLNTDRVLAVIDDILKWGMLHDAFELPDEEENCQE